LIPGRDLALLMQFAAARFGSDGATGFGAWSPIASDASGLSGDQLYSLAKPGGVALSSQHA
jgi:hypothetical protein